MNGKSLQIRDESVGEYSSPEHRLPLVARLYGPP